jgi:hypothetical protein
MQPLRNDRSIKNMKWRKGAKKGPKKGRKRELKTGTNAHSSLFSALFCFFFSDFIQYHMLDLDFWIFTLLHVEIEKGKKTPEKKRREYKKGTKKRRKNGYCEQP